MISTCFDYLLQQNISKFFEGLHNTWQFSFSSGVQFLCALCCFILSGIERKWLSILIDDCPQLTITDIYVYLKWPVKFGVVKNSLFG